MLEISSRVIDKNNPVLAIELDYLPIWLAKIAITPKMQKENPQLVNNLLTYQLKAKDVLAKVFIHQEEISKEDLLILGVVKSNTKEDCMVALKDYTNYIRETEVKPLQQKVETLFGTGNTVSMKEYADIVGIGRNKLLGYLREMGILTKDNIPYRQYNKYFDVINVVKGEYTFPTSRVTSVGQDYLYKKLVKEGYIESK